MKTIPFKFLLPVLLLTLIGACSCTQERLGMSVPAPGTKPTAGEFPSDDPDEPLPPEPSELDEIVNNPARLARIGETPIIEMYFTEYTKAHLFPSLEEVRYFNHVNVGHGRFANKKTGDGGIVIADEKILRKMVAYKADYPELKVKLMIGGWGPNADGFSEMAKDDAKRALFVSECVRICNEYGVDGFDIDWEYPTYAAKEKDYVNGADPSDWGNFVTLFKEMREAMPDKILSYAASSSGKYTDNYGVLPYADYINVMTYDEGNVPYHNSPLYGPSPIVNKRTDSQVIDDIFHGEQGIPYQMMNFGLPFYGHGDGYKLSTGNYYPGSVTYGDLEDIFFKGTCNGKSVAGKNYRVWDDVAKVPYLADAMGRMYASYEDIESINWKVDFLMSRGMLGAMIWEFREDDDAGTLRHAVKHAMEGNPDPPGKYERPDEYVPPAPAAVPVMGKVEFSKKLQNGSQIVKELSGLCLSKDGDFLWGVGDEGTLYKINFDGSFSVQWTYDADMESLCMDPATGDMYMGIEPKRVYKLTPPYTSKTTLFDVAEAESMGNSGIEGIAWHKGNLYLGAQTGATLWEYTVKGDKLWKKSLRDVTSTISEIAGLDYDQKNDWLWVIDSNSNKDKPQYLPFTVYLFNGDATKLLATYPIGSFADWNPESICVDRKNGCIWIADDCGDAEPSILHKVLFTGL